MTGDVEQGWWRASDGYWYPAEARPGQLWTGRVIGPNGEEPPGPGWWLANDYQWYPPDARPGELWLDPVAHVPSARATRLSTAATGAVELAPPLAVARPVTTRRDVVTGATGVALMVLGVALLALVRAAYPDAGTAVRLLAWSPVAVGSSVTLIAAMRYLGLAR